jgi:hypothetical protein
VDIQFIVADRKAYLKTWLTSAVSGLSLTDPGCTGSDQACLSIAACAAANRAIGTRKGEQLT